MASLSIIIFIVLISLTAGCKGERYEMKEDRQGRIIRLDRRTGEVTVLEGDSLIHIISPKDLEALSEAKSWPIETLSQLGGIIANLKTSWRKGQLYYLYSVSPGSEKAEDIKEFNEVFKRGRLGDHYFTVNLYKGGFNMMELRVPLVSMTSIVDVEGKTTKLERNGAVSLSVENYQASRTWDVTWSEGLAQLFQIPVKKETMGPVPKSTAETTTPSGTAMWSVQVNAFAREENARSLVKTIKNKGYDAFVISPKIDGRTWYRVRVGQFASQKEAKQLLRTLIEKEKYPKAIIARSDMYSRIAVPK